MIQNNQQNFYGYNMPPAGPGFPQQPAPPPFGYWDEEKNKEYDFRRKIRAAADCVGIPCLLLVVFSLFWRRVMWFVTDNLGISRDSVSDFFKNPTNQDFISILISVFLFVFVFSVCMKVSRKKISELVSFKKAQKGTFLPLVLIGTAFCMFSNILNLEFENFFESFGTKYSVGTTKPEITLFSFTVSVVSTAIVPALVEEYACRGLILGNLLPFGEGFAVLTSAILFGLLHGNFEQMPFAFLVGLILGYIRINSGSLWPCILVHMFNNLFSVVAEFSGYVMPAEKRDVLYFLVLIITLLTGTICALIFTRKNGALTLDNGNTDIGESKKYKLFFTSPIIVVIAIAYIGLSLRYFG